MTDMPEKLWRDPATQDIWSEIDWETCDEDDKLVEYRRADLPPSREQVAAMVKPLVFMEGGDGALFQKADSPRYAIGPMMAWGKCRAQYGGVIIDRDGHPTQAEAIEFCNRHYTRRILAALGYEEQTDA